MQLAIDLMHNDVTRRGARGEFGSSSSILEFWSSNSGILVVTAGKLSNMATVFCVLLFFSLLLEALQANEDPSSLISELRGLAALKVTATTSTSTKRSGCFTCCVSGFVLPTIKEIQSLLFIIIQVVKVWNQNNSVRSRYM